MNIPHCPNPLCTNFEAPNDPNWYTQYGYYTTRVFGTVSRYRCRRCRRTFSSQTFSIDYYAKKVISYTSLIDQLVTASGLIDMSRNLHVRVETIENRLERLSRCALAIHSELLHHLAMKEDLVADGLESFSFSQYYPNHVTVVVGSDSEFIYSQGFANLRRKGRMTPAQAHTRSLLETSVKADPRAVEKSFRNLMSNLTEHLAEKGITRKHLITDEHKAYVRALSRIKDGPVVLDHEQISSKRPRTRGNKLFPVNYLDRQIRKDVSDHVRQTVQFARCPSALMARMSVYRFYHNCCIPRRVKESRRGNRETHAERAGIPRELLENVIQRHWGKRCFLHKVNLGSEELKTWLCEWRNPGLTFGRYVPGYASV